LGAEILAINQIKEEENYYANQAIEDGIYENSSHYE
jgi:hypothetical protein